jgi:solute:Na+ symporter, SSS family
MTVVAFSAVAVAAHPGLLHADGFPYGFSALAAVAMPFTGILFFKRQWMLGRHFGYAAPGRMLAGYFGGRAIAHLTVVVTALFSIWFLAAQLGTAGYLFAALTDGALPHPLAMGLAAAVLLVVLFAGGFRGAVSAAPWQGIAAALGMALAAVLALDAVGGWQAFQDGLAQLAASGDGRWGTTGGEGGGDYDARFAIAGFFGPGTGSPWTGIMILSFILALMGILAAPVFSAWVLRSPDPSPFALQQVWMSAFAAGAILIGAAAVLGISAHLPGAETGVGPTDSIVPGHLNRIAGTMPWLAAALAVCVLAAIQAAGAVCLGAAAAVFDRDLFAGRWIATMVLVLALGVAHVSEDALALLGGVAAAFALQMWVPLAGLCWISWLTRAGVVCGLAVGLIGVVLTESMGVAVLQAVGIDAWDRWPLTIHSAAWGLFFNVTVAAVVSALTQEDGEFERRHAHHQFLDNRAALSPAQRDLAPVAWIAVVAWLFFAIGPGAILANDAFGLTIYGTAAGWTFGIPSIWAWQGIFWLLGVGLVWFLARRMGLSTLSWRDIEALRQNHRERNDPPPT